MTQLKKGNSSNNQDWLSHPRWQAIGVLITVVIGIFTWLVASPQLHIFPVGNITPTTGNSSTIQGVDNSAWIANSPALTVSPSQQYKVYFTFKNIGTTTWSSDGGYALVCDTFHHNNNACMEGQPVDLGTQTVAPSKSFTFYIRLTAPTASGTYSSAWSIKHNGIIFGWVNAYVQITVQ